jgi:hypothetical protein
VTRFTNVDQTRRGRRSVRRRPLRGSPRRGKSRTFLNLTVFAGSASARQQRRTRLAYHFEGAESLSFSKNPVVPGPTARAYRNPVALAREWRCALSRGTLASRAALARELGVTRARVTQVLSLLDLAPEVARAVEDLGDPLASPVITERMLRPLLKLPADGQLDALRSVFPSISIRLQR